TAPVVEQVHARHILLPTEADALDVLIKLQAGESFANLASQYSLDRGSKDEGGDLGFFPRGVMPPQIETVAFGLGPGQISGIVHTDFGYHIIQVVERDPARPVAEELLAPWRQTTFSNWLNSQRATAKVEYLVPLQ
ncbi:MAG TPA: peptidylprolyl isomerase, partial [Anaerolineae bacterium]|nr:peptidylprolyl isomerase [Anaerolineae bacterium]